MAAVPFVNYIPDIEANVMGATDTAMVNALRSAMIEFCVRTRVWEKEESVATVQDQHIYAAVPQKPDNSGADDQARFVEITDVYFDNLPLKALSNPNLYDVTNTGRPGYFYRTGTNEVGVYPTPDASAATQPITVRGFLAPVAGSSSFDFPDIELMFMDYIVHGACARLLKMPSKPWTDFEAAGVFQGMFENGVVEAMRHGRRYASKVPLSVRYGGL